MGMMYCADNWVYTAIRGLTALVSSQAQEQARVYHEKNLQSVRGMTDLEPPQPWPLDRLQLLQVRTTDSEVNTVIIDVVGIVFPLLFLWPAG